MPDDELRGRCISCGYLCRRNISQVSPGEHFIETEDRLRSDGELFASLQGMHPYIQNQRTFPFCFAGIADFQSELAAEPAADIDGVSRAEPDALVATKLILSQLIKRDRQCDHWTRYHPGFGPREHFAYQQAERLEAGRRRFETGMEQRREAFEQRMEDERREWESEREGKASRVGYAIAAAGLVLALAQVLTVSPDSWLGRLIPGSWWPSGASERSDDGSIELQQLPAAPGGANFGETDQ